MPFGPRSDSALLRQIQGTDRTLVDRVADVRASRAGMSANLHRFRLEHPGHYLDLLDAIEWTLRKTVSTAATSSTAQELVWLEGQ
jgi:hypothetical protein